jgi:hypothetical protein
MAPRHASGGSFRRSAEKDLRLRWGMSVKRLSDGAQLTGSLDTYVWGWSTALRPGGEPIYLVEPTPNPVRFDLKTSEGGPRLPAPQLLMRALVGGLWQDRGTFPIAARPAANWLPKIGGLGTGDYTGVRTLLLADRDGDGLSEVDMMRDDGTHAWVGWNATSGTSVVKP